MGKPTPASVTEEPCKCGSLELAAKDPRSHIVFDPKVSEYHFRYPCPYEGNPSAMGSRIIYHCFFCGGAAPASKRHELFTAVTPEERERVFAMFDGLETEEDIVTALGPPDKEFPEVKSRAKSVHSMQYTRLSDTVDAHVRIMPSRVQLVLSGKYIGQEETADGT